jgi:hypothetical protein
MNKLLFAAVLLFNTTAFADDAKNEWHNTSISDATIAKIQTAKFDYKKCVSDEMQKGGYLKMDTRNATDAIMKQCETVLGKIREVYLAEKIPGSVADRHLKQMRLETTRKVLQNLMFSEAARTAGQP